MECIWIPLTILVGFAASQTDPCQTYQEVNDTTFKTDNVLSDESFATCEFFPKTPAPIWFRYTATESGAIANSCPERLACGARQQIWINGSFPRYSVGETSVPVCISNNRGCCELKSTMLVKNCNTFYVYNLRRAPNCYARYCFNESSADMETLFLIPTSSLTSVKTQSHSSFVYVNATTLTKQTKTETIKPRTTTEILFAPISSTEVKTSTSYSFFTTDGAKTSIQTLTETLSKSTQTKTEARTSFSPDFYEEITTTTHTYLSEATDRFLPNKDFNYTQTGSMTSTFRNKDIPTTSPEYGSKETKEEKEESMVVIIAASVSSVGVFIILSAVFAILFYRRFSGRRRKLYAVKRKKTTLYSNNLYGSAEGY